MADRSSFNTTVYVSDDDNPFYKVVSRAQFKDALKSRPKWEPTTTIYFMDPQEWINQFQGTPYLLGFEILGIEFHLVMNKWQLVYNYTRNDWFELKNKAHEGPHILALKAEEMLEMLNNLKEWRGENKDEWETKTREEWEKMATTEMLAENRSKKPRTQKVHHDNFVKYYDYAEMQRYQQEYTSFKNDPAYEISLGWLQTLDWFLLHAEQLALR